MRINFRNLLGLNYAEDTNTKLLPEQKRGLNNLYVNGVFGMFSENAAANYTNLFLLSLNASNTQIGLLNTLSQIVTAIMPLPGASVAERTGAYRKIIFWPNVWARLAFLLLAALPLLGVWAGATANTLVLLAIGLMVLRAMFSQFTSAAWTAFVGKLVPRTMRVQYFSARTFAMSIASMAGTLTAGWLIAQFAAPLGYQIVFGMACVVGLLASFMFWRIPPTQFPGRAEAHDATPQSSISGLTTLLATNPTFLRYTVAAGVLALAVGVGGPFIQVYMAKGLGFSAAQVGLTVSAEMLSSLLMGRVFGSIIFAKFGDFRVMRLLRFFTALVPLGWVFIRDPFWGVLNQLLAGVVWSGHELAAFNGLLAVTPEQNRARFIALNALVVSVCGAVGPALGGVLSEVMGYQPLFALSAALRFVAAILFFVLVKDWNRANADASAS
jgi:MFS family permease